MATRHTPPTTPRRLRRRLVLLGAGLLALWLAFFDSHSLLKRVRWHNERVRLQAENAVLEHEIAVLADRLEAGISDDVIEQIARVQYGMRRPGETVYPVAAD